MSNNQIVYIDVNKIHPHPNNPRKNLGDLTELTESIKVSGILQNLTIVPKPDGPAEHYYAVIGHRRHSAARKAGLKQVPCVVSSMDEKEQVRTMMVENMNRSDLTVYEQAEGFQMMLDFGDSVLEIAGKTGFSESTVRRRVKLLELDKEKLQQSVRRGATLQDFMELEQIKDPCQKDKLLESIGTANFNYELKRARDQEKEAEKRAAIIAELETFAVQVDDAKERGMKYVKSYSTYGKLDLQKPDDAGKREYFFTVSSYNIWLYTKPTAQDKAEDTAREEQQAKAREQEKQLDKIAERTFQLRYDFVKNLTGLKKQMPLLTEMTVQSILLTGWAFNFDGGMFLELVGVDPDENDQFDLTMLAGPISKNPERVLLAAAYSNMGDNPQKRCHRYEGRYQQNEGLDLVYDFLERLGYEISDEEQAYKDGTHILFRKEDTEGKKLSA